MGSGGTNTLWPPGKLVVKKGSEPFFTAFGKIAFNSGILRLLEPDPKLLGVIWSSLTGN